MVINLLISVRNSLSFGHHKRVKFAHWQNKS